MTFFVPPAFLWILAGFAGVAVFYTVLAFIVAARINREGED